MNRVLSLDVFRGMTIVGMIIVNTPGSWKYVYPPLLHAKWHGCTLADLVFPFFLFIMGVAISLSLKKYVTNQINQKPVIRKILKRSLILFVIGLLLNTFPYFNIAEIRIPGVLQRIAIVFLCSALIFLKLSIRTQIITTIAILVGYWLVMTYIPVPGSGIKGISSEENLAAWLDQLLLEGHLWSFSKTWDPEGILSTFPAIASCLSGIIAGQYVFSDKHPMKPAPIIITSLIAIVLSYLWSFAFPYNKSVWTSTYVLLTSGLACFLWLLLYWILDQRQVARSLIGPFKSFGLNAIVAYAMSILAAKILLVIPVSGEDSLYGWIYQKLFQSWMDPYLGSLWFALIFLCLIYLPIRYMDRSKIYIKV